MCEISWEVVSMKLHLLKTFVYQPCVTSGVLCDELGMILGMEPKLAIE